MDSSSASAQSSACRDDDDVRRIWEALAIAGATVPVDPLDLDLTHLARAEWSGIDVRSILAATTRSGEASQTAA